jgi:hypothetical protein
MMSTFGRNADKIAEQVRERRRRHERNANWLHGSICFAITTLADKDLDDATARQTALDALRLGRNWSKS